MRAPRKVLTDAMIASLKPAPAGAQVEYPDGLQTSLVLRVTSSGKKTFLLLKRFPGSSNPTRRALGVYPQMTLSEARKKADEWLRLISLGVDPKEEEERKKAEKQIERKNSFQAVIEAYLADIPNRKRNRHAEQDAREIRRELLDASRNKWLQRPISEVTDGDIGQLIAAIRDRPAPGMAITMLGHVKALFSWAQWPERRQGFNLKSNVVEHLKPKHFGLSKNVGVRVLSADEIRAYWAAAEATPYPLGSFYKMLILTGQRKSEVAEARWSEFDLKEQIWTIPPERFKTGMSHIVPLTKDMLSLLRTLEKNSGGDHLFSFTNGVKAINGFSRAKKSLDGDMLRWLREQDATAQLPDWVFHDIRRTVRTRLSSLWVPEDIAELVIGHAKLGIRRVYDHHRYGPQMLDALDKWNKELMRLVAPPQGDNVIPMKRK